ncbi:MAG TPA: replicative DNA helicase [Planctomycetes bacterium]|nr:replicative DNA helicase [Planctomycetota bacterium]
MTGSGPEEPRAVPHNLEAEKSVLSSMFIHEDTCVDLLQILDPQDFYLQAHQHIFRAIRELYDNHKQLDPVTVGDQLEKQGVLEQAGTRGYLYTLVEFAPTAANAHHHAEIIRSKSVLRKLIEIATEIAQKAYKAAEEPTDLLDEAEARILEIARDREVGEPQPMEDLIWETYKRIESYRNRGDAPTGVPTGFHDLDEYTSGLQPGELIIIAARPSMGKTSFALNLIERSSAKGNGAVFFSLEMTSTQVTQNMLCAAAQVDAHKMRRGFISQAEQARLQEAAGDFYKRKVFIDDTPALTLLNLRSKARRLRQKEDIKLIVIDYLQLLHAGTRVESRQQEISLISRSLKGLAKELEIPVVALSQLNRGVEQRDNHRPRMSDLRESGAIEQDADVIMMLHREEYYKPENEELRGLAELILAKQRNGPTGTVKLRFFRDYMRFESFLAQSEPVH